MIQYFIPSIETIAFNLWILAFNRELFNFFSIPARSCTDKDFRIINANQKLEKATVLVACNPACVGQIQISLRALATSQMLRSEHIELHLQPPSLLCIPRLPLLLFEVNATRTECTASRQIAKNELRFP